jgi:DNA replication protein DnaC
MTTTELLTELPPNSIPKTISCAHCGRDIPTYIDADAANTTDPRMQATLRKIESWTACDECRSKRNTQEEKSLRAERIRVWEKLCPRDFLLINRQRLPRPERYDEVMLWSYNPDGIGLLLCGPSGAGKSRCAWKLLSREFFSGKTVAVLDSSFAITYAHKVTVSPSEAYDWLNEAMDAQILLLDDVFKVRLHDSGAESALFSVVTARTESKRPMIVTTQDVGRTLVSKMSPDRGEALVRRLKEFCSTISFA